jgi:hypothetical protein
MGARVGYGGGANCCGLAQTEPVTTDIIFSLKSNVQFVFNLGAQRKSTFKVELQII